MSSQSFINQKTLCYAGGNMKTARPRLTRAQILDTLKKHDDTLRKYSVRRIGLFGSYARGEQKRGSDVDLLVELETPSYNNFYDLSVSLEKLLRRKVELVTNRGLSDHMRPYIEQDVAWHEVG